MTQTITKGLCASTATVCNGPGDAATLDATTGCTGTTDLCVALTDTVQAARAADIATAGGLVAFQEWGAGGKTCPACLNSVLTGAANGAGTGWALVPNAVE